jgi:hypothetical protein
MYKEPDGFRLVRVFASIKSDGLQLFISNVTICVQFVVSRVANKIDLLRVAFFKVSLALRFYRVDAQRALMHE